jgi:hypothetical protein
MRTPILLATLVAFGSAAVTDDLKTMSDRKAELLVETSLASVTSIPKW